MLKKHDKFSLSKTEEDVLSFWKKKKVPEELLRKSKERLFLNNRKFVFYEGPPTANGRPGIHHILARVFKDVVLRYKTMRGFYVPRKGGWDTHGLPVEIETEKQLGLRSKKEIEEYGIAEFNAKCKESVWKYKDEWERLTKRIGFWLDLKDPYITYENSYMESIWWILKEVWKKKLLYKGYKVVPWCPRCGTGLSSHELALGYKQVSDMSVYVKFELKSGQKTKGGDLIIDKNTYILSWTTTPWTLPGNVALAVGADIDYVFIRTKDSNDIYVMAKERISDVIKSDFTILESVKGRDLEGLEYNALFNVEKLKTDKAYKIYLGDFVTTEDGTGVVHTAVMYGEDDYNLGKEVGLPQYHTVDEQGRFITDADGLSGMSVKSKKTEEYILEKLEERGFKFKTQEYEHEYPFCWRCSSPLIYYARDSWFIAMSKLREELISLNNEIKWIPENIKEGRFGDWIREVKDWAISRSRYWGTPLPIWECGSCDNVRVCGSKKELISFQEKTSKNKYILIRHGEAENNTKKVLSSWPYANEHHVTKKGFSQIKKLYSKLKRYNPDLIFSSDITRTKETAEFFSKKLKISKIHFDERLREISTGELNGQASKKYDDFYSSEYEKFIKKPEGGESLTDVRKRVFSFIKDIEKKYSNKTIIIVSHGFPLWMLESVLSGWSINESISEREKKNKIFFKNAEMHVVKFISLPRDDSGAYDMHKPFIDEIIAICEKCGGEMKRVSEVVDVWFDSGAMPFAEEHFPFETGKKEDVPKNFPADYIAEGIDQTRGWFYTLLAISALLGRGVSYKNVISLGLILDKNGQKMSKSKNNAVDPWNIIEKYGVDAIRWYFYTVNPPGEPKKFNEVDIGKVLRRFILLIYNSFIFFDTYASRDIQIDKKPKTKNILDEWIFARLSETKNFVINNFEKYEIGAAGREIENFISDFSRWYIRRSRRRLQKPEDVKDYNVASQTLGFVLLEISKLIAPFTPFFAEALYQSLRKNMAKPLVSVHMEKLDGSKQKNIKKDLISEMEAVRNISSEALANRAENGIKIRQPLKSITLKDALLKDKKDLLKLLMEEINVKEVVFDNKIDVLMKLDMQITQELKNEGIFRELVRTIQGLRQDAGLETKDKIMLFVSVTHEIQKVLDEYSVEIKKEVNAKEIKNKKEDKILVELETKLNNSSLWVGLRKI